jgi:sterol desaturase/sphingolipid hydroxylase (fatty acid hydroxylase superfamily)
MSLDAEQLHRWRGLGSLVWLSLLLAWESLSPFFHSFASLADRGRHGLRNFGIGVANGLMTALVFAWVWRSVAELASTHQFGILNWLRLPTPAHFIAALLLFDLWTYFWHRAGHVLPHLWKFHRMHHSDPQMDVTTSNRFHLVEIGISSVLRIALIPLLGITFTEIVVYETLLQFVVQLQHANVGLPPLLERGLRLIFVTPILHKIHHSQDQAETDSNFASLFSFWDRIFGTFRLRPDPENIRLGLAGFAQPEFQTWGGLWKTPFREPGPLGDSPTGTTGKRAGPNPR